MKIRKIKIIKQIYTISNSGNITHYYHFFFAVLIPFINLYLKEMDDNYIYDFKFNLGQMVSILKYIFPNKIINNYDISYKTSCIYDNYNLYCNLNNLNDNSLLPAYDIFENFIYLYIDQKNKINSNQIVNLTKRLENKQANYNRKVLLYTHLNNDIINNRLKINSFFNSLVHLKRKYRKIILIEREQPKKFISDIFTSTGGERRFIYNHKELNDKLTEIYGLDFENIICDNLNIVEQYNIFKNASVIIAQHGAAISNIYFCNTKKNVNLIEITPSWNKNNNAFKNLANSCSINYSCIKQSHMTKSECTFFFDNIIIKDNYIKKRVYDNINLFFNNKISINKDNWENLAEISLIINCGSINIKNTLKKIKEIL